MARTDDPTDTTDDLPVPAATARSYLRVRPTGDGLGPGTVVRHVQRLHGLERDESPGLLARLRRKRPIATIEVLLVSRGGTDAPIEYYLGSDADVTALERVVRGLFPNTYEFETVTRAEGWLGTLRGRTDDDAAIAGVEFRGRPERSKDWQTRLTPFTEFLDEENARVPLAAIAEAMAASTVPMVYQALLRPKPDWTNAAIDRQLSIESGQDTIAGQFFTAIWDLPEDGEVTLSAADEERLEEIAEKDARRSFDCNARAVAIAPDDAGGNPAAEAAARDLANAFGGVSHTSYAVDSKLRTGRGGREVFTAIQERTFVSPTGGRLPNPLSSTAPGVVADATEAPSFFVLDGAALTAGGSRAVAPTPGERVTLPRPPKAQLDVYRGPGFALGHPLTHDGTADPDPVVLPPSLQPMHIGIFGKSGAGKTTGGQNAILANHDATDGADILIEPKGDGMAEEYLRAHYAKYGTLDNVLYFDCSKLLPAFSFFNIREELAAGIPRTTAVEDTVDHYIEILIQIMDRDRFNQAVRSPDIIRYLLKAMFDPVNGRDAFSHREFHSAIRQMHERQAAPPVSDDDLEQMLGGVVANRSRTFDEIMQGVANRIEKVPVDRRLARIFNHVPGEGDPHFDLEKYLDEDVVIIFDTGELRSEAQRVLTLLILSNLWTALRRRAKRSDGDDQPLVNLYIEEAASVAVSGLLKQLLSQSRSFDCSVTLAMQYPAQLKGYDQDVYEELLNNISTFVTGNVAVDNLLTQRLATDDMDAVSVGNRLRALRRGQWLVTLPAPFDEPEPRPFLVESLPLPPGDPDGPQPLSERDQRRFETALGAVVERTRTEAGLALDRSMGATQREPGDESESQPGGSESTESGTDSVEDLSQPTARVDSALPYTKRLPLMVEYDDASHALRCLRCENRYDASSAGMKRAIACCASLEEVDRDDIPICDINLKLAPEERAASDWSDRQLMFVQAVYNAQQLRYDPLEYDLLSDSMIRLQEYVGIDTEPVQALIDAGVLRHDTDHPHRLYTVTPEGRAVIGESYRQGVDYGHGAGDLEESSQHVFAVEVARQYLEQEYVEDPESRVVEAIPYYDLDENRRLDLAGVDSDGDIVVAVEAERINNDVARAVPEDFDKMATCEPEEAIWVVMTRENAHDVLAALNDPLEGPPRVEKTYARTTHPRHFSIDTPGLTAIHPVERLRDVLDRDV